MIRSFRFEFKRIFAKRLTWLFLFLQFIMPVMVTTNLFGLIPKQINATISDAYILEPAKLSLIISAVLMVLFTLLELRHTYNENTYALLQVSTNPLRQMFIHVLAIICISIITILPTMLVMGAYTAVEMQSLFSLAQFLQIWLALYLWGVLLVIVLTAGLYMSINNAEIVFIFVMLLIVFSITRSPQTYYNKQSAYLLYWLQTFASFMADGIQDTVQIEVVVYTRLVYTAIMIVVYVFGLLCVRKYGKGAIGSLVYNSRNVLLPCLLVAGIVGSTALVKEEPFFAVNSVSEQFEFYWDAEAAIIQSESDFSTIYDYQAEFNNYHIMQHKSNTEFYIDSEKKIVKGENSVVISHDGTGDEQQRITVKFAAGINITSVHFGGEAVVHIKDDFSYGGWEYYHIWIPSNFEKETLNITYEGRPLNDGDYPSISQFISEE
ncbi:MAG: hypothetical protein ACOX3W_04295 [Christensenellaceae bacterium]|jgi:hypothetical protein